MAGRWKVGAGGQAVWDPNETGPDQIAAPGPSQVPLKAPAAPGSPNAAPVPTSTTQPAGQSPTVYGNTGINGSQAGAPVAGPSTGLTGRSWHDSGQREVVRDTILGSSDPIAAAKQLGFTPDASGRITLPDGEVMDVSYGANAGINRAQWTGVAGGPVVQGGVGGAGSTGPGGAGAAGGPGGGSFQDQIRSLLLNQLQGLSQPVSANDPTIQGQVQAQEAILERLRRQSRAASAERAAATGLNSGGAGSGALSQDIAAGFENKGQQLTGLQAQLYGRELESRRGQLSNLLNMALQSGDAESARALQLQLSQMDNAIRQQQLNQQQSQFNDQFGFQLRQHQDQQNLERIRLGLGD